LAEAIFLSASVPDPKRSPEHAKTADPVAITAAVSALVFVTLGRRMLVWGGHPAITPMIWVVAESMGVEYGRWVRLYQSNFFEDAFPEDNERFRNVIFTEAVPNNRERSLFAMRERMFEEQEFHAAVFIGGMQGILDEYDLFRRLQPKALVLPIVSTGGAAIDVSKQLPSLPDWLSTDMDYVGLFHRCLGIDKREIRYPQPDKQPLRLSERLWHPSKS
jgi:hypothetical protein